MLNAYNSSSQSVGANSTIVYDSVQFNQGVATTYNLGTGVFSLNRPGVYEISFNAVGSADAAGDVSVQLFQDGTAVENAIGTASSTGSDSIVNVGFSTLIEVFYMCPMMKNTYIFTVQNVGDAATYTLTNVIVKKVK